MKLSAIALLMLVLAGLSQPAMAQGPFSVNDGLPVLSMEIDEEGGGSEEPPVIEE